jgi:heme-degrading monooxygenase HmoA
MHARVTTVEIQPGTMEALIRFYEEVAPQLQGLKGFERSQLLTDRAANKVLVADPRATAVLAGAPVVAVYEIAAQVARTA